TVRRYLEYKGYTVDYVLNFTDVDDKIIKAANERGEKVSEVADRFVTAYLEDVEALGVNRATHHPRVTESIDDIITFIEALIEKGFAMKSMVTSILNLEHLKVTGNYHINRSKS